MSKANDIVRKYILGYNDQVRKFCQPLMDHFGMSYFWYHKVTEDGSFTTLGNNVEWNEYFMSEKLYLTNPYLRHPDHFQNGIILTPKIQDPDYQNFVQMASKRFGIDFSLACLEKTAEGIQGYGFALDPLKGTSRDLLISELHLLQLFIRRFKENFKSLLQKMDEDLVQIPIPDSSSYFNKAICMGPKLENRKEFLRKMGLKEDWNLSSREKEVIQLTLKGYSANQAGQILSLSQRTVEHYLENLKNKLNCFSKAELVQKGQELALLDFII